jgi:transcriptional regulator with XRE-family HTH domain
MTGLSMLPSFHSTSASGAMRQVGRPLIVGVMLFSWGTSGAYSVTNPQRSLGEQSSRTTSAGQVANPSIAPGDAIAELRSLSGLTWEQLGRLMGVSRRSLHLWASGKSMASANEEKLSRILAVIRRLDRGAAAANRAWLMAVSSEGQLPFDLLMVGDYGKVVALCARPEDSFEKRQTTDPVGQIARDASSSSPDELVGALQDRVHRDVGRVRPARGVKTRSAV